MACLYCGKDTGAFGMSQDGEFCCPAHRADAERLKAPAGLVAADEASPEPSDIWMPSPAAEAMARQARLSVAYALCGNAPPKPALSGLFRVPDTSVEPPPAATSAKWTRTITAELAPVDAWQEDAAGTYAAPGMPEAGFIPPNYHCRNVRGAAVNLLQWHLSEAAPLPPRFGLRPAVDRLEDLVPRRAAPKSNRQGGPARYRIMETIAAGVLVGIGLWYGAGAATLATKSTKVDPAVASVANAAPVQVTAAAQRAAGKQPEGWLRRTIANRAAVEFTDTFQAGMASWDAPPKNSPQPWSRNPDGYVRTGQLALYRPSVSYSDYRLEFFAQIESKSMGWVVRARDRQNYYAMKFTVVEPGLRPIIAMVHYSVIGGKKGNRVEIPLSVMVHNDTPYHVEVEVKGNRVTTSIEGQEVDQWSDETLAQGGVGFFSDPGERARLYWMKLAANNDFLGRVCAYLSGGSERGSQTIAEWRRLESPMDQPQPGPEGAPRERCEDVVLAAAGTSFEDFRNRRIQAWGFPRQQSPTMRERVLPA